MLFTTLTWQNAPLPARWGVYGEAQGTSPAVPGRAVPSTGVSVGLPLRDAYPEGIPPVVDLTGAAGYGIGQGIHAVVVLGVSR